MSHHDVHHQDSPRVETSLPDLSQLSFLAAVECDEEVRSVRKSEFKTLVLDLDGTLVESEPAIVYCIFETAAKLISEDTGEPFSFDEKDVSEITRDCFGRSDDEMSVRLLGLLRNKGYVGSNLSTISESEFIERFRELRKDRFVDLCKAGFLKPMPGAIEFLQEAFNTFGPLALNTGSPKELAEAEIKYVLGAELAIDEVIPPGNRTFGNEPGASYGKPDPLGYTMAAIKLHVCPSQLVAVVDRANDAKSALHAGYGKVVVIPENQDIDPFLTGKHSLIDYFQSLPEDNFLRDPERVTITAAINNILLVDDSKVVQSLA